MNLIFFLPLEFEIAAYENPKKKARERVTCECCKRTYQITRQQAARKAKNFPQTLTCGASCSAKLRTKRSEEFEQRRLAKKQGRAPLLSVVSVTVCEKIWVFPKKAVSV